MTRSDINHLAQVLHSLKNELDEMEFRRVIDRMLWAIHASHDNPRFEEERFVAAAMGEGGLDVFAPEAASEGEGV